MRTIIIADSLTHDFASPLPEFLAVKTCIGRIEIERVLGAGARFGEGPLPAFLRAARDARRAGAPVDIILVRDLHDPADPLQQPELLRYGNHALVGSEGAEFLPFLDDLIGDGHVIDTPTLSVPAEPFHRVMRGILGRDLLALTPEERDEVVFVVTGFYTEVRVLSTAFKLRNDYGFPRVCVCPHLVGSRDRQAHLLALQGGMPNALVTIVPGLAEMARIAGLAAFAERVEAESRGRVAGEGEAGAAGPLGGTDACRIEPAEVAEHLDPDQVAILRIMFLTCSRVELVRLGGGYSGSLLFLARGEQQGVRQAPRVVKVSKHEDIQRELAGYGRVKDLLGTCVPTIDPPVSVGCRAGIAMTLASMQGSPRTFQRIFVSASSAAEVDAFLALLDRGLSMLCERLLVNTRATRKYSPYQEVGLTDGRQRGWLRMNVEHIVPDADLEAPTWDLGEGVSVGNVLGRFETVTSRVDYLPADGAVCHGDLNFANLLADDTGAIWLIDWPYCDDRPVETDFAKLENDIKLVMSPDLEEADLPRLQAWERFLVSRVDLPDVDALPEALAFVASDARFAKMHRAVRLVRQKYAEVKRDPWVSMHLVALLRYAVHTLSFDRRRGRGECSLVQLKAALISVDALLDALLASPLHSTGKRDRPAGYPERFAVPAACVGWDAPLDGYRPPDLSRMGPGSSLHGEGDGYEPDDWMRVAGLAERESCSGPLRFSADGRPLNPTGRTGIAGRGFFWRWGPNPAVDPVITRVNPGSRELEFALVKREDTDQWGLPGGMVRAGEDARAAVRRIVLEKTGLEVDPARADDMGRFVVDDYRNTDHAWAETTVLHFHMPRGGRLGRGAARVVDAEWLAIDADFGRDLFAGHARFIRAAIERVHARGDLGCRRGSLEAFLAQT